MKAPYWFPQSFFSRTLWLVLIVVLFSKALTLVYLMMNEDVLVDRQYSHGAALTLRAYWAASEAERDDLAKAAGLKRVTSDAVPPSEQHWPYSEIFERQMQTELGPDTEVRLRAKSPPALWVQAPALGPDWVRIPLYPHPLRGQRIWSVLGWFLGIGLLSTAAAWIFVRQLNAPLKRLVFAARQLGQGRSVRLPVSDTPSEMTEVYRAFNQMAEDVEQAARERELMLAGVSHDLRTPLTRLHNRLEGLHHEATGDSARLGLARALADTDQILQSFGALLRLARIEAQAPDAQAPDLALLPLAKDAVEMYAPIAAVRGIRIETRLHEADVRGDRDQLFQMLVNLLDNALKYAPADSVVTVTLGIEEGAARLEIADRGPGIPETERERVFDRFQRLEAHRGTPGVGLGLSLVRAIVHHHGGRVALLDNLPGLRVRVMLPLP